MCDPTSKHQRLLAALRSDVRRLDLAQRDAYAVLLAEIQAHPPTAEAHRKWTQARDRYEREATRLDVLEAATRARKGAL